MEKHVSSSGRGSILWGNMPAVQICCKNCFLPRLQHHILPFDLFVISIFHLHLHLLPPPSPPTPPPPSPSPSHHLPLLSLTHTQFYSSTASAGKDVAIILDMSPSSHSTYISTIQQLLQATLTPLDHFVILAGNASSNSTLLPSRSANFKYVMRWLTGLHFFPSRQEELLRRAFGVLNSSRSLPNGARASSAMCQSAIIMITDREMGPGIPPLVNDLNARFTQTHGDAAAVKIFVNSMTTHQASGDAERNVTCDNGGIWQPATSHPTALYRAINMALSRSVHVREPVWPEFGTAPSQQGFLRNGTSLCLPVTNRSMGLQYRALLGIACTILPLVEVEEIEPGQGTEVSEVWVLKDPGVCRGELVGLGQ